MIQDYQTIISAKLQFTLWFLTRLFFLNLVQSEHITGPDPLNSFRQQKPDVVDDGRKWFKKLTLPFSPCEVIKGKTGLILLCRWEGELDHTYFSGEKTIDVITPLPYRKDMHWGKLIYYTKWVISNYVPIYPIFLTWSSKINIRLCQNIYKIRHINRSKY